MEFDVQPPLICSETTVNAIRSRVRIISVILREYTWLIDAYVSNFFVDDLWAKLPTSWQKAFYLMSTTEMADFLDPHVLSPRRVLPLSLLSYRTCMQNLALSRQCLNPDNLELFSFSDEHVPFCSDGRKSVSDHRKSNSHNCTNAFDEIKNGQYTPLESIFRKHVKPKKQHEILNLGKVVHMLCRSSGCEHVVDVGAGQGHLSRLLTFKYGVRVTTVEASGSHAPAAEKFDREAKKAIHKSKSKDKELMAPVSIQTNEIPDSCLPNHITCTIFPGMNSEEFLQVVKNKCKIPEREATLRSSVVEQFDNHQKMIFDRHNRQNCCLLADWMVKTDEVEPKHLKENTSQQNTSNISETNESMDSCLLMGLHACGDLTPTMLRVFTKSKFRALASVSCCYMKMTCSKEDIQSDTPGYPMSQYSLGLTNHSLNYEAREMACHSADVYIQRLRDNEAKLKLHCYRAALQVIINRVVPNFEKGCMKLDFKHAAKMTFEEYVGKCFKKLGVESSIPDELLQEAKSLLHLWKNVVAFYVMRLCLAPVVEALILLDRMLFLFENGIPGALVPIFDPVLSPRNFVLLAMKR
ncbi:hypothetical protein ScPMuIL_018348 [Solemya velum]